MIREEKNHQYLINLYSSVDEALFGTAISEEKIWELIINFCTIIEKVIKIQLHELNPVLIYEYTEIKDPNSLIKIVNKQELDSFKTIKMWDALQRYQSLFNIFTEVEVPAILSIYEHRKNLIHGINSEENIILEKENIIKKMGTIWGKIAKQMESVFWKELIKSKKPKKIYSEAELEKILKKEVEKKIQKRWYDSDIFLTTNLTEPYNFDFNNKEKCPRCGNYTFYLDNWSNYINTFRDFTKIGNLSPYWISNLYKCSTCKLELTEKEYEISKKLRL